MSPRLADLDLPASLDNALADGRLVVFAGAGVSVSPPSSLPTFDGLTARIGEGSDPQGQTEPFEVYLGRLASGGVLVHQVANEILSVPDSQPNSLHRAIAGLWRTVDHVRIVTTNFDLHFETALRERWPSSPPEHWAAPALPVGSSFNGLVHLHGRLGRPDRLVLTDIDFGRAYLTEGWARRFLTALFQNYVVLFVGYSHRDAVLSYLARGLAPTREARRYALTDEAEPSRWRLLGVEPISYDPANDHASLLVALQRWGEFRSGGALEHQERVALCCSAPPISRQEADYLLWCIERPNLAQFFIRAAHGVEWIEWLHAEGYLLPLLSASNITEREILLLHWLAHEMCASEDAIERALALLAPPQVTLSAPAFRALAGALWRRVEGSSDQPGAMDASTAKAILFLLPRRPVNLNENAVDYLLKAIPPEFPDLALSIFDELTRPLLQLDSHRFALRDDASPRTSAGVTVQADGYWIRQACEGVLKACLPTQSQQVLTIARHHLEHADRQMKASGQSQGYDRLSSARDSIADEGDEDERSIRSHYPFYALVDAARDAFAWLIEHEPTLAARQLVDWSSSPAVLAQRVAMHGLSRSTAVSGDERLDLIVDKGWLDKSTAEPELLNLLASAYPAASPPQRRLFLDHLRELRVGNLVRTNSEDEQELWDAQRYLSALTWLRRHDAGCALVCERIEEVQRIYPELEAREPDPGPRIRTAWVRPVTRYSVAEMHEWAAEEFLRRFAEERASGRGSWDTDPVAGYLEEGAKAVSENFEWGLGLAQALLQTDHTEPVIWGYILRGWQTARLPPEQWQRATSFLAQHLARIPAAGGIADLLERRVEGAPEEIPDEIIQQSVNLARALWIASSAEPESELIGDWLTTAINRPAGKLALFVLRAISLLRQRHGDAWVDAAPGLQDLLQDMAARDASRTPLARVVLCSHLAFLYGLDPVWSTRAVIPLFDWTDPAEAKRSWSGFLVTGRPTTQLWPRLKGMMRATFDHLPELEEQQPRFAEYVAAGAFFFMSADFDLAWLQVFLRAASSEARRSFADHLGGFLRDMEPEAADRAWRSWIRDYVVARLAGKPPLDEGEWASMHRWLLFLGEAFEDAVAVVGARSARFLDSSILLYELAKMDPPPGPALALAEFLLHLLRGQQRPMYDSDSVIAIARRIGATGDVELERALQERFVELGGSAPLFPNRS